MDFSSEDTVNNCAKDSKFYLIKPYSKVLEHYSKRISRGSYIHFSLI